MTKRKKTEPIKGTGQSPETHLVQKSNPLYGLWRSDLTLAEFKILDAYLGRINSHDPEKRTVRFEKGEIESYLGVKKINTPDLKERLKHLGTMVPIDDGSISRGFRMVSLFEQADCEQDEDGIWQVDLTCTHAAVKYIFNVENFGFFKYTLHMITRLRSRYSYILFLYLEKNRCMHLSWEVDIDELRRLLKADEKSYQEFKHFNALLLKPCHRELLEKVGYKFTYEPVKRGRFVKAVRFTLEPLAGSDALPGQMSLNNFPETAPPSSDWDNVYDEEKERRSKICFGFEDTVFSDFTDEQLVLLKDLGWSKKSEAAVAGYRAEFGKSGFKDALEQATADYLKEKILMAKTRHPKDLFLYVKKMVENDN